MTIESEITNRHTSDGTFQLSVLAAILSGGKNPADFIDSAKQLYNQTELNLCYDDERHRNNAESMIGCEEELRLAEISVWFKPNLDSDELRGYLSDKGFVMKKAETVRRNLREFFKETGQDKNLTALKSSLSKTGRARLLKTTIDEFIRYRKKRKSEGGKKSFLTRKKGAAKEMLPRKKIAR